MPTSTTNYELIKPGTDDPILIEQINDNMDTIDTVLKDHSDKIDAAALGIKFKGEVNYYSNLPNDAEIGDAYTVKYSGTSGTTPDGTEYVWGTVSGINQWINFSKDSYTKAEVDALLALKQNALTTAQLAAANSGINSEKVAQYDSTTELEAKDRAALVELVDGGAKNLWDFKNAIYSGKSADASYTKTDTDITVTSNGAWSAVTYKVNGLVTGQRYVWSVKISDYSVQSDTCRLRISSDTASQIPIATKTIEGNGNMNVEFVGRPELYFAYYINFSATSYQNTYKASENMICTKAAWGISHAYQPYRPSYQELYEMVKALQAAT